MSLNHIRLTKALVESLFTDAITRLEAGEREPKDDLLIDACKAWLSQRSSTRQNNTIVLAADRRLKRKLAKAKADGHFQTLDDQKRRARA